jgi:hypothetical protein
MPEGRESSPPNNSVHATVGARSRWVGRLVTRRAPPARDAGRWAAVHVSSKVNYQQPEEHSHEDSR